MTTNRAEKEAVSLRMGTTNYNVNPRTISDLRRLSTWLPRFYFLGAALLFSLSCGLLLTGYKKTFGSTYKTKESKGSTPTIDSTKESKGSKIGEEDRAP